MSPSLSTNPFQAVRPRSLRPLLAVWAPFAAGLALGLSTGPWSTTPSSRVWAKEAPISDAAPVVANALPPEIVKSDPQGHGLLCRLEGKPLLLVDGTPSQMGAAHGRLLGVEAKKLTERVLYMVGGLDTLQGDQWFLNRMAEIERRTQPHMPQRFRDEVDAAALAADIPLRDARYANLFPERFHCSGVAVRGKATRDGRVYHARVLDYMRDINLQGMSCVAVFMPKDYHAWMNLGYAGFIGTVTAMNDQGLAVGEMGGRGEGQWDGLPMSFLLRDVMERASTVDEALEIVRTTPRTCEYYYVFSDRSGNMAGVYCTPEKMDVLSPGEQSDLLPPVPEETVMFSAGDRAETLSRRLHENFGQIDAARLIEIIKRPVAMSSNLHNAVFAPESLDMWFANAGKQTPACDEPYTRCNLGELVQFYKARKHDQQVAAKNVPSVSTAER